MTREERVWQRLPQGWIEFTAHGDRTPDEWLDWYLASSEGWISDEGRESITAGFHAGVEAFGSTPFAFAGVSIILGERPSISFMGTQVIAGTEDDTAAFHRLFPVARFGADSVAETFTAPDSRVGTVTRGAIDVDGRSWLLAVGEIPLPDDAGTVVTTGIGSDPAQSTMLALGVAFALTTTQLRPDGEPPQEIPAFTTESGA